MSRLVAWSAGATTDVARPGDEVPSPLSVIGWQCADVCSSYSVVVVCSCYLWLFNMGHMTRVGQLTGGGTELGHELNLLRIWWLGLGLRALGEWGWGGGVACGTELEFGTSPMVKCWKLK